MSTSEGSPSETIVTFYDGDKIVAARRHAGLKQKALAERVGISAAHLCNIELGKVKNPSPEIFVLIARHTGRTVSDFMREPSVAV